VTLALLFDSDVVVKKNLETSAPAPLPTAIPPAPLPPERARPRRDAVLAFGVAGLAGVLRAVSPAASAEAGIAGPRWRMSLGALWALPQAIQLGPGTVHEQLWGGFARTCFAPLRYRSLRFDVCTGAAVGLVTAEAEGYTRNERRTRQWAAVPFELALAGWSSPVGWEISLGGLAVVRRQDFSIEGLGVAYESPQIGGTLTLRVVGLLPW
jgi:hypothetical protein